MKTLSILLSTLCLLSLSSGCGDDAEPEATEPTEAEAEPTEPAEPEGPTKTLMAEHFRKAWSARDAVIRGDFDAAKRDVGWLAEHDQGAALPAHLRPKLDPMQQAANEFVETQSLTEAGAAFARMLHRCGQCHTEADGGPEFEPAEPPEGEGVEVEMQRHRWAADRMWEGMVTPDPEAFARAAEVLAETPMGSAEMAEGTDADPARLEALVSHVHEMAEQAEDAENEDARILAYGRFVASCAACHRLVGKGPGHDSEPSLRHELVAPAGGAEAAEETE